MTPVDFDTLICDEPPFALSVEQVIGRTRRSRRRRQAAMGGSALAAALLAVGATVLAQSAPSHDRVVTVGSQPDASPQAPRDLAHPPGSPLAHRLHESVLAHAPAALSFDVSEDKDATDGGISGTVDDGDGKGYLYVSITTTPRNLQPNPCGDPEFAQGQPCVVRPVADGAVLITRSAVNYHGVVDVMAEVLRPDGTGVHAQSVNAWWPGMAEVIASGTFTSPADKERATRPEITRAEPVLSLQQLADLLVAVSADMQDSFAR
ncbi:MAG: hypothetical protein QOJ92_474 [Frankiales bacterium]|jgi:hypothetical protein|nr:hypothetical protein [Frankiales bacterium]